MTEAEAKPRPRSYYRYTEAKVEPGPRCTLPGCTSHAGTRQTGGTPGTLRRVVTERALPPWEGLPLTSAIASVSVST